MYNFGLYVIITNPVLPYRKIAEICANNEIRFLQLREKNLTDHEILQAAFEIHDVLKGSNTSLMINDRLDLAMACRACGLHLGQEDMPFELAEKVLGKKRCEMLMGLSTHNLKQLEDAQQTNADYLGFGPVFPTTSKEKPDPVVGLENLKKAVELSQKPLVAIGGIFPHNLEAVLDAGAKNICLLRYLMESADLDQRIKEIKSFLE